ncbi:hypothetical protein GIB67_040078 [Kingdonia uniflora]|uniref:Zuotin-like zuotin homology domain-containing protein n=1 Tax=Kingdonia uniflora TaxID=39325 RepID=A0A7J7MUQ5_9MAGN|nr:hypothetical protein GIB67_040078 [Kingdonia uniflora]
MHYCSRACGVAQRIISIALREEIDPEEQKSEKPEQAYTASSDSYSSKGKKKSGVSGSQQQDHYALLASLLLAEEAEAGKLAKKDEIENHFKSIQEAYEIFLDPVKRRVYDSTDDFDDEVPTDCLPQDFFKVFGPAFMRNGRWSASQPVPSLGDDNTPIDDVDIFYDYWYSFKSWREFPHANDFDLEQAESRDHKRWMERQNAKLIEKARKEEYAKRKEEEKANKKKKKEAKFIARKLEEEEAARVAKEEQCRKEEEDKKDAEAASTQKKVKEKENDRDLEQGCPHHGIQLIDIVQTLYEGLDYDTRARVQPMCAGTFDEKTDTEAWIFLNDIADKTYQWQTMREEIPSHRANVHQVDSNSESATLRTILEKIMNLETGKRERRPNTLFVNHVAMPNCVVCESSDHLVQDCPDVLSLREGRKDQANAMYQRPNNQPFNGGWNNNSNNSNSWGNRNYQGGSSGSASYQPHNQVNQHQSSSSWQQNLSYQAPLNVPYVPSHNRNLPPPTTSLEDTLKAFMQVTQSSIAKLEGQIGQMAIEISTRDKGMFPSQTQANPKGNTEHPRSSNRDGVNAINSLRSGTKVDNLVKIPKEPELEIQSKPIKEPSLMSTTFERSSTSDPLETFLSHFDGYCEDDSYIHEVKTLLDSALEIIEPEGNKTIAIKHDLKA